MTLAHWIRCGYLSYENETDVPQTNWTQKISLSNLTGYGIEM